MNRWCCEKTVLGYLVVFKTPQGEMWFKPDTAGNIRCAHSTLIGLTLDLRDISAIAETVKAAFPAKKFGSKNSPLRGEYCERLFVALNEAQLFPRRMDVA